jgi:hypothetical protein
MEMNKEKEFEAYGCGILYCSVCSSLPLEETIKRVNIENPTNIDNQWQLAQEPFRTGEANPHPCEKNPKTHQHYLFVC